MKRPDSSLVALTVGALGSAAANTAWTWEAGPVRVIAGLFTTALVPVAMHLWNQVPVTGRWTRFLRFVVMAYICGAAAVVNLAHAVMLLTDQRNERAEHIVLAVLSITAVEALMVMASLARRKAAVGVRVRVSDESAQSDSGQSGSVRAHAVTLTPTLPDPALTGPADPDPVEADPSPTDPGLTPADQQESGVDVADSDEADRLTPPPDPDTDQENAELVEKVTAWAGELGSVPSRERIRVRYAVGSKRAEKIRAAVMAARQADPDSAEADPLTPATVNG